jgi:beta-glucanase (GH16 family)
VSRRQILVIIASVLAFGLLVLLGKSVGRVMFGQPPTVPLLVSDNRFSKQPTWEYDFTKQPDGKVDPAVWRYDLDPDVPSWNDEQQAYTNRSKNVRIEDGRLIIEAHKERYRYPNDWERRLFNYTSGRIDTLGTKQGLAFTYGKVEVVMKMPSGRGTWPAAWILTSVYPYTSKIIAKKTAGLTGEDKDRKIEALWRQSRFHAHDGELDIVEHYGHTPDQIEGTAHVFKQAIEGWAKLPDATKAFHTYGMEVTPTKIIWTLDGRPYHAYQKSSDHPDEWPFTKDNKFFLILNLAMGGDGGGEIDNNQGPWRLETKQVRFYQFLGL